MILYDHPASGNCMKARILLRQLELPYERVQVDLFKGETRTPEHFGRNPDGRIPVLELDDGRDDRRVRRDPRAPRRGHALPPDRRGSPAPACTQWMFFEQNRIEAELAYARFLQAVRPRRADAGGVREPARARHATRWWRSTAASRTAATSSPGDYSIADIALYAYVHCADDAGAELEPARARSPAGSAASRRSPGSRTTWSRCRRTRSSGRSSATGARRGRSP